MIKGNAQSSFVKTNALSYSAYDLELVGSVREPYLFNTVLYAIVRKEVYVEWEITSVAPVEPVSQAR